MGSEAVWVPLVISALGAGASAYNTNQTAKRQDQVAAEGIRQQASRQKEADQKVAGEVDALKASNADAARKESTNDFLAQLRRTASVAQGGDGITGAANERFLTDTADANTGIKDYGQRAASILGRIAAPGRQRMAEGQSQARLASALSVIGRGSEGDAFLNNLRLRGVNRNPWIDAGASIAGGAAGGMADSGYGAGVPAKYGVNDPRAIRRVDMPATAGGVYG